MARRSSHVQPHPASIRSGRPLHIAQHRLWRHTVSAMPSSADDLQTMEAESNLRGAIRKSLVDWAQLALSPAGHQPAAHHLRLITELEAVSRGDVDRLIVLMPPGSAKSTYASILFPVWWLTQHAASAVLAVSHTADLAEHFGGLTRNLVMEHRLRLGYALATDKRAAASWRTTSGGSYHGSGTRGPVVGRRADLVLIDDPVKSQAEADSAGQRDHVWSWYRSDLIPRLKPGGRVVLIMTRWHEDDLGGRLLQAAILGAFCVCRRSPRRMIRWVVLRARLCGRNGRMRRRWRANVRASASGPGLHCISRHRDRCRAGCSGASGS